MEIKDKLALLKINSAYTLKTDWISSLLQSFSPSEIINMTPENISLQAGISYDKAAKFLEIVSKFNAEQEMEKAEKIGARIIYYGEENYPECFKVLEEPPLVFYIKGNLNEKLSLSVVGTRNPTDYGVKSTVEICSKITKAGINIVSGLARGIDTVAHKTAIKNKGITFAVIGSGFENIYPPENKKLSEEIVSSGGAILSEYPLSTPPLQYNFPRRNRLISALSWGTFVVEGDYNSGALITARYAIEQNKEVMALPGPIDSPQSNGPNKLIKDGAYLIQKAEDIIATIPSHLLYGIDINAFKEKKEKTSDEISISLEAKKIYEIIEKFPEITPDELSHKSSIEISSVNNLLLELELNGLVVNVAGKYKPKLI